MRNLLAIALFLLLPLSASGAESAAPPAAAPVAPAVVPTPEAAPHSFTAIAAPDKVKLGQTFVYTIEVRHSKDERYELPKDLFLGDEFNVIKIEPFRTTQGDDAITRFAITAALFDLGEKKIPDVKLAATTPRGQAQLTIPGPPVTGGGELKEEEEGKLFDIMPPVDVKVPRYTALYIIAGTILATLLALLLLRWWRNRPLKTVVVKQVPRLPAHERALAALAQLQSEELPASGRDREFFFRLSEILRDYLGERFGFHALDMTTEELLATLQRLPTPGLDYASFERLCREGDMVKFAKAPASPSLCKIAIEGGFALVRATMLSLPATSAPAAQKRSS